MMNQSSVLLPVSIDDVLLPFLSMIIIIKKRPVHTNTGSFEMPIAQVDMTTFISPGRGVLRTGDAAA